MNFTAVLRCLCAVLVLATVGCATNEPRRQRSLNKHWKFIRQDVDSALDAQFDDVAWESVTLPHTWNLADGADGANNYYRGPGWYRRRVKISDDDLKRSLFLRFDGASMVADVFVNGQHAGQHRGGFSAFCFDVTKLMRRGENVIAVRVDNMKFEDVTPISGDFTIFGGLYRDVNLLVLDRMSISPMDDASSGVYLLQRELKDDSAIVEVRTKLRNAGEARSGTMKITIADGAGRDQWSFNNPVAAFSGEADNIAKVMIPRPHLWDGVNDPYLYRVRVELCDEAGRVRDRVTQPLGLRTVRVDPQKGFFLNGRAYAIRGVNRHQERLGKGWAISPKDVDQDFKLMREMGVTAIRGAHYQHSEYEHALCDRLGMIVWAELALVNYVTDSRAFDDNAKQQLRELIKQNFNHPSIAFWSLYNELRFQEKRSPADLRLVRELNDLAHELDPTRLTTAASNMPADHPMNLITDVLSFNRYWGWYRGSVDQWGAELDKIRAAIPAGKAIAVSEYGAGASIRQHEAKPATAPPTTGPWHPEEWQSIVHEKAYGAMKERPWLWGTFLWVMFDFASDGRNEGDRNGVNDKGLVTGDRKTRKDAFYFYKANWTNEPFVHITSRRFTPRPPGAAQVKVYSNGESVELFLNGKSLGPRGGTNGVFVWSDVPLAAGKNDVRAVTVRCSDQCTWTVTPSATTRLTTP